MAGGCTRKEVVFVIAAGDRLYNLYEIKLAIDQGFALKIVETVFTMGEMHDDNGKWVEWTGTDTVISYENRYKGLERDFRDQWFPNGEIFAVPMAEYAGWEDQMYGHWDWDD